MGGDAKVEMSFPRLTLFAKLRECGQSLLSLLVVVLPALSYPLSWVPRNWAHFRFDCTVPWPEIILAGGLLVSVGLLLREGATTGVDGGCVAMAVPRHILLPGLAVVASGFLSTRFSEHPHFGLGLLPRVVGNVTVFWLAAHGSRRRAAGLGRWWMIAAVAVAINGLLRLGSEPEFVSTLGNWNFLGAYLAASVVVGTSIEGTWPLLGSFVLLGAMCFCGSRGAWLALGAVALLWFLGCGNRLLARWYVRVVIVLLLLAGAGAVAGPYVRQQWRTDVRPPIWKATLHMIASRPLLGHGLGAYVADYPEYRMPEYFLRPKATNVTDHAHNELLEIAAEQGLIGLAATLWVWVGAMGCGIRTCRQMDGADRRALLGLLGAAAVFMFHSLVDVDLRYLPNQSLLWLLMGLLVGADAAHSPRSERGWWRIAIHTKPARWCAAAACLVLGIWVATMAVLWPMAADWQDRAARIAEENGDLRAAAQRAWDALRLEPFRLSTRYLFAGVLSRLPDAQGHGLAIDQCLRIEKLAPDYADVTFNLGQLYLADNRVQEALPCLRRAAESNPFDADRRFALASALLAAGLGDEARSQLDRAVQLQPDHPGARELREKIHKERAP
jgi:tetratricopeptide (TPR) repeat protein